MPSVQDTMFHEAISAIEAGERSRARDLLTRLLKTGQDQPDYWVWMSAVVDTAKERAYCLNQAIKLDSQHQGARRGLVMLGQMTPDERLIIPARLQKRNWQARLMPAESESAAGLSPVLQMGLMAGGLIVVVALVLFVVFAGWFKPANPAAQQSLARRWPTETASPSATATSPGDTAAGASTQAASGLLELKITYTPTPLYIVTPHPASVAESYKLGLRNYARGDWANMENFMKQVLTVEPGALDVRYYLADSYRLQGKRTQALNAFNDLINQYPDFAPAYLGRARVRLAADATATDDARGDLQLAIKKDPNLGEAYLDLIVLLLANEEDAQAKTVLDQAVGVLPDSPLIYLYRAEWNMHAGQYAQALSDARRANQLDQTLLPAYLFIGQALNMTGDLAGSQHALDIYTTYVKDDPRAWLWVGLAHEAAGEPQKALEAYDQAVRLNNRQSDALLHRARLLLDEKEGDRALEDYRAALRLDSQSFEASMGVGKALLLMDYEGDAYMQFERSQGLAKEDTQLAELTYWRAVSLEDLGELEVALREWKKLLTLPKGSVASEWVTYANQRIQALATSTPTSKPPTATRSVQPTQTRMPTRTPSPSRTLKPTRTP